MPDNFPIKESFLCLLPSIAVRRILVVSFAIAHLPIPLIHHNQPSNRRQKKRGLIAPLLISYRLAVGVALSAGAGNVLLLSCCASLLGVLLYCFPSSISSLVVKNCCSLLRLSQYLIHRNRILQLFLYLLGLS